MNTADYYEILGVSKNATIEEIKSKYRILAKKFHPDKENSSLAEEMMKKINEAYEVLSEPQKRKQYDQNNLASRPQSNIQNKKPQEEKQRKAKKEEIVKVLKTLYRGSKIVGEGLLDAVQNFQPSGRAYDLPPPTNPKRTKSRHYRVIYDYDDDFDDEYDDDFDDDYYVRPPKRSRRRCYKSHEDFYDVEKELTEFYRKWF